MDPTNESRPVAEGGRTPRISRQVLDGLAQQGRPAQPEKVRQLRGVVASGVERHSRVLVGPQQQVLAQLIGGPPTVLADGSAVVVTGVFLDDLHTTVQQGRAFRVDAAEPDAAPQVSPG